MKRFAVIVAGGSGTRMKSSVPKQFMLLAGKPVLAHTLSAFHVADPEMEIILVLPKDQIQEWEILCSDHNIRVAHRIAEGGQTRFHSVKNGLRIIQEDGIVAVHDGVRPLISPELIRRLMSETATHGNAVPAVPVKETMRELTGEKNRQVNRNAFRLIQTPQCFQVTKLKEAFSKPYQDSFTDEANVAEASGILIHLSEGEERNIKITTPEDLKMAEFFLKSA